jgi:predicted glycogen debranching enzyme
LTSAQHRGVETTIRQIVEGYASGTRFGIRDRDGLLAAGIAGVQLTWMDARVGNRVITPRVGKPVEIQALWLNALSIAARFDPAWRAVLESGRRSFNERFWNDRDGYLADVIDVDHVPETRDDTCRPNQILAVGGLPVMVIERNRARRVVDAVERRLLTPLGLRSLSPDDPAFAPRYEGGPDSRDAVYHQGTVWPWLMGPFIEAWSGFVATRQRFGRQRAAASSSRCSSI